MVNEVPTPASRTSSACNRRNQLIAWRARLAPSTCYGNRYSCAGSLWGKLHLSHRARNAARRKS
jgi:hypothetical protein